MADDAEPPLIQEEDPQVTAADRRARQKAQSKAGGRLKASVDALVHKHPACNILLYVQSESSEAWIAARCHGPELSDPSIRANMERLLVAEVAALRARRGKRGGQLQQRKSRYSPEQEDALLDFIQSAVAAGELGRAQADRILADHAGLGLSRFRECRLPIMP